MNRMHTTFRTGLLGLSLLLSCRQKTIVQAIAPALKISPSTLQFPLTAFGATNVQTVTLQSISSADVHVTLSLSGLSSSAYSLSPAGMTTVPGTQSLSVQVTFAPQLPSPIPSATGDLQRGADDPERRPGQPQYDRQPQRLGPSAAARSVLEPAAPSVPLAGPADHRAG